MRSSPQAVPWLFAAIVCLGGCEVSKSRNPLSPNVAGPIPGVDISAPRPLAPSDGARILNDEQPIGLELENPTTTGERTLYLQFQVSTEASFGTMVHRIDRLALDGGGRTVHRLPLTLEGGRTYYWRSRAFDGANTGPFSATAAFSVVVPVVLGAPTPVSPANGSTLAGPTTSLVVSNGTVSGPAGTLSHRFEVARDQAFTSMVTVQSVPRDASGTTTIPVGSLALSQQYFWRVMASDGEANSPYSPVWSFRTPDPVVVGAPQPLSPADGSTLSSNATNLVVSNGVVSGTSGIVTYRFEVAQDPAFGALVTVQTVPRSASGTTTAPVANLAQNQQYFWRAIGSDGAVSSPYSPVWSFRTPDVAPPPPPPPVPTIGPPRTIGISEALSIVVNVHDTLRYNLGSNSTRDERVRFFFAAVATIHYGHAQFNPRGPDSNWCVKDAGGGRPPSDDVIVNCRTREAWDLISGAGANGYTFDASYIGVLPAGQNVYSPPQSSLP